MELLDKAKKLRKNSTSMESKIWNSLRSRRFQGFKFRRQCPLGNYIVDFICIEKKLIIEIDGGQHNECRQNEYDKIRTNYLNHLGYKVLRFWNNEVQQQFDLVMDVIYNFLMNDA
ncbi:endonuclease domain-containing protein [Legionella bononiensis]|uniref:Endonuclease domain-containing protein n=1 Tax=Legionella bononiensis TaxID=2793102 RepID=A0ABS1WBS8_9GAMM|nr:DUF559 domain-containing protein [Legionella bononiensis]MBL7481089.1 endonuclease domain-containing protein [Legionella bononiensis]MBL7526798.1 endonuclease domain-containing protein [Legionella bononiensis]MBL7564205.1 endonuclease domain-containing protein [Legionella bononiensis]